MPELTWQGKGLAQTAPASLARDSIIYPNGVGYPDTEIENHLLLGENLSVMNALLPEYEGRINLIYADPPFFTNRKYPARIGRGEDSRKPDQWQMAEGYHDNWDGLDAYLDFLYQPHALVYPCLAPKSNLYLHIDGHPHA